MKHLNKELNRIQVEISWVVATWLKDIYTVLIYFHLGLG